MTKNNKKNGTKRGLLSRSKVLMAAVKIADKQGVEKLSMRNISRDLNVEAMSLYNHVNSKEDVLDGMVEIVVSKIHLPSIQDDWKNAMRQRAISAYQILLQHPWAAMLLISRKKIGPNMLRYVDATLGCLREAGFSYKLADQAWNTIDCHIYGYTLQLQNFPFETTEYADAAKDFLPQLPKNKYPYLHALSQQIADRSYNGMQDFHFGLEIVLDGLERLLELKDS